MVTLDELIANHFKASIAFQAAQDLKESLPSLHTRADADARTEIFVMSLAERTKQDVHDLKRAGFSPAALEQTYQYTVHVKDGRTAVRFANGQEMYAGEYLQYARQKASRGEGVFFEETVVAALQNNGRNYKTHFGLSVVKGRVHAVFQPIGSLEGIYNTNEAGEIVYSPEDLIKLIDARSQNGLDTSLERRALGEIGAHLEKKLATTENKRATFGEKVRAAVDAVWQSASRREQIRNIKTYAAIAAIDGTVEPPKDEIKGQKVQNLIQISSDEYTLHIRPEDLVSAEKNIILLETEALARLSRLGARALPSGQKIIKNEIFKAQERIKTAHKNIEVITKEARLVSPPPVRTEHIIEANKKVITRMSRMIAFATQPGIAKQTLSGLVNKAESKIKKAVGILRSLASQVEDLTKEVEPPSPPAAAFKVKAANPPKPADDGIPVVWDLDMDVDVTFDDAQPISVAHASMLTVLDVPAPPVPEFTVSAGDSIPQRLESFAGRYLDQPAVRDEANGDKRIQPADQNIPATEMTSAPPPAAISPPEKARPSATKNRIDVLLQKAKDNVESGRKKNAARTSARNLPEMGELSGEWQMAQGVKPLSSAVDGPPDQARLAQIQAVEERLAAAESAAAAARRELALLRGEEAATILVIQAAPLSNDSKRMPTASPGN